MCIFMQLCLYFYNNYFNTNFKILIDIIVYKVYNKIVFQMNTKQYTTGRACSTSTKNYIICFFSSVGATRIDNVPVVTFLAKARRNEVSERRLEELALPAQNYIICFFSSVGATRIENVPVVTFLAKARRNEVSERRLEELALPVQNYIICFFSSVGRATDS